MFRSQTDDLANAVRLLVAMGGFATAPTPQVAASTSTTPSARSPTRPPPVPRDPGRRSLTDERPRRVPGVTPTRHADADAPLRADGRGEPPHPDGDRRRRHGRRRLRRRDAGQARPTPSTTRARCPASSPPSPHPTLTPLLAIEGLRRRPDARPSWRASWRTTHRLEDKIDDAPRSSTTSTPSPATTLEALALALRRARDPNGVAPRPTSARFLIEKAKDYRRLVAQVEAIDERTKRSRQPQGRGEGRHRPRRLRRGRGAAFPTSTRSRLRSPPRPSVLRADNALLRGRVEEAYTILSAAADSFAQRRCVGAGPPQVRLHEAAVLPRTALRGQGHRTRRSLLEGSRPLSIREQRASSLGEQHRTTSASRSRPRPPAPAARPAPACSPRPWAPTAPPSASAPRPTTRSTGR